VRRRQSDTAQQELEHQLSKAIAPEQALALENFSGAAKALLSEILKDDRSGTKGVSFMLISETQGFYVPYLWDNHVHGALQIPMIDIATQRMAADELARKGVLNQFPRNKMLHSTHLALNSFQTPKPCDSANRRIEGHLSFGLPLYGVRFTHGFSFRMRTPISARQKRGY
jgi:hypothetical protein